MLGTCALCGNSVTLVHEVQNTILRHPDHTKGVLKNSGVVRCVNCEYICVLDPWDARGERLADIRKVVVPPLVEWITNSIIPPQEVKVHIKQRIEQNGSWQPPLGWQRQSLMSFMSAETTEHSKLDDRRFYLNSLDQESTDLPIYEYSGYYLLRCFSRIADQEFDLIVYCLPSDDVYEQQQSHGLSGNFLVKYNKRTGEMVDIDVSYPDPPCDLSDCEEEEEGGKDDVYEQRSHGLSGNFLVKYNKRTGEILDIDVSYPDPPEY